jgi:hypothetical protein
MRLLIALPATEKDDFIHLDADPSSWICCRHPVSPFIFSSSQSFYWIHHPPT